MGPPNTLKELEGAIQKRNWRENADRFREHSAILALCGWKIKELCSGRTTNSPLLSKRSASNDRYLLSCEWCHRTVGNWNFQSDREEESSKRQKTAADATPSTKARAPFDPLQAQHLSFCPWVHAVEDERPGWEQVLDFYLSGERQQRSSLQLKVEE